MRRSGLGALLGRPQPNAGLVEFDHHGLAEVEAKTLFE